MLYTDIRSYNKQALLAKRLGQRVIPFIVPKASGTGRPKMEIQFPFAGRIIAVMASCTNSGTGLTLFQVEKSSVAGHEATPQDWMPVLQDGVSIPGGEVLNQISPTIVTVDVAAGDFFRINILALGTGVEGLTVALTIQT
jgi:hypothetical protein